MKDLLRKTIMKAVIAASLLVVSFSLKAQEEENRKRWRFMALL